MILFQVAAAASDPSTFLGSSPAGWITNGIVVALVLFIRHLYEGRIAAGDLVNNKLEARDDKFDQRDQVRAEAFARAIATMETQAALLKQQNETIVQNFADIQRLVATMQGRLDEANNADRHHPRGSP